MEYKLSTLQKLDLYQVMAYAKEGDSEKIIDGINGAFDLRSTVTDQPGPYRGESTGDDDQVPESLVTQAPKVTSDSGKKAKKSYVKRVTSDSGRKPKRHKILPFTVKPKSSLVTQGGMTWE